MLSCLVVGVGGFFGAILRYLFGLLRIDCFGSFPIGTFLVNVIGSFIIGLIIALSFKFSSLNPHIVLLIKVGFCGGFTTFSTFALESLSLLESGRLLFALFYIVLSVILSVIAVFLAEILVNGVGNY